MLELLAVGTGGFFGCCARYLLTRWMAALTGAFPLGTLLSNVLAGFAAGLIIGMEQGNLSLDPRVRLLLITGVLGGLSTFSTFSVETMAYLSQGKYPLAAGNILLNLGLSLSGVAAGIVVGRLLRRA